MLVRRVRRRTSNEPALGSRLAGNKWGLTRPIPVEAEDSEASHLVNGFSWSCSVLWTEKLPSMDRRVRTQIPCYTYIVRALVQGIHSDWQDSYYLISLASPWEKLRTLLSVLKEMGKIIYIYSDSIRLKSVKNR